MTPLARSVLKPTELGSLGWLPDLQILEVPPPSSVGSYSGCVLSYVTTIHFESARLFFHVMWLHALSWHESFTTHVMHYGDDV